MKLLNQPQFVYVLLKLFREMNNENELLIVNAGSLFTQNDRTADAALSGLKNKWYLFSD